MVLIILVCGAAITITLNCVEVTVEKDSFPEQYPKQLVTSLPVPCGRHTAPEPTFEKQSLLLEAQAASSSNLGIQEGQHKDPSSSSHILRLQRKPGNTKHGREWY